jgi:streptogramin lyase
MRGRHERHRHAAERFAFALLMLSACRGSQPLKICYDADGDGYGKGCARGPDCDDSDPRRAHNCGDAGADAPDCEANELAEGCPCLRGDRQVCYAAPADTRGVGPCRAGMTQCVDQLWSECAGEVLPELERCNGADDDCDGFIDEGVQSPCGGCNEDCRGGVWGPPADPFDAPEPLAVTASGELTLAWHPYDARTLWVPNTDEGSVSKLDAASATELARYRTRGGDPIRVAVDHRGDAWVVDGSFGGTPYLSKLAGDAARCRDRNGDGVRTSHGATQLLALGQDECVLLELPLMAAGDDPRALSVDGSVAPDSERAGNVWVGFAGSAEEVVFDGASGEITSRIGLGDFHPYASAFDRFGVLWSIDRAGLVAQLDPGQREPAPNVLEAPFACYSLESLSLDQQGRLLLSGFGCEDVISYDPQKDSWRSAMVPMLHSPRGVLSLASGSWVGYEAGALASVDREQDPMQLSAAYPLRQGDVKPFETVALSADAFGQVWAISTQGGPSGTGLATRFDPDSMLVTAQVPVGRGPRGSGDLSGYASGGEYARAGSASHVFGGCGREARSDADQPITAGTRWLRLHVQYLAGAGATIAISVRRADDEDGLDGADFIPLGTLPSDQAMFSLSLAPGGVVEVKLDLSSPSALGAPRVARVGLEWDCPQPD